MKTLRDAVIGLAIGDAIGVPVEFTKRGSYKVETMTGFGTHNQKPGTWSDDTSMTIATCDSIREKGFIDCDDIRHKFNEWLKDAKYTVDNRVFDCGITVHEALMIGRGLEGEYDNGNGSLMRIIPLAFTDATDDEIRKVSAITHAHEMSTELCVEYIKIARHILNGGNVKDMIPKEIASRNIDEVKSSGFVKDTYEAALWAIANTESFKDAILCAVNLGSDTDTVGAVTGALAGIIYGIESAPAEWYDMLRGKDIIERCLF